MVSGSYELTMSAGTEAEGFYYQRLPFEVMKIYDISGRLVANLLTGSELQPGMSTLSWDGRDTSGRRCPRGVYHCHIEVEGERSSTRLVFVR